MVQPDLLRFQFSRNRVFLELSMTVFDVTLIKSLVSLLDEIFLVSRINFRFCNLPKYPTRFYIRIELLLSLE